jgi:ABC-2 type transport system permease protein
MPIFDQGYQHWSGKLSGHTWRWLAITRQGVRAGLKNRYFRLVLLIAWVPALMLGTMLCVWGLVERNSDLIEPVLALLKGLFGQQSIAEPKHYRAEVWTICYDYFLWAELYLSMLLILLVGPNLISADLRFNALPLYLSRPLRRVDYLLGKLGVIGVFIGLIVIVPAVVAYVLGLLFSLDITIVKDTYQLFFASILYGLVIALSAGMLILALSSLSRNSRYVALLWIGILVIGAVVSSVLESIDYHERIRAAYRDGARPSRADIAAIQQEISADDWRPLVSYTANLSRIRGELLGTNKSWETLYAWMPPDTRAQFLNRFLGPAYPWYWSAAVLLALLGLSTCILKFKIKSLDRLK